MAYEYDTSVGESINLNDPEHLDRQLELMDQQYRNGAKRSYRLFRPFCGEMPLGAKIAIAAVSSVAISGMLAFYFLDETEPTNDYVLPKAPPSIANTCSEAFIASDGPEACQEICEVAECCDFPVNFDLSCLYGNQELCLEYHASCNILKHEVIKRDDDKLKPKSIPKAPKNIDEVCSKEYLPTSHGLQFCSEVCFPARCCYDDEVVSCTNDFKECQDYAPCLILSASNNVHEDIVEEIESKCDLNNIATTEGRSDCDEVCANAFCCFQEVEDGIEVACPHNDNEWCSQYLVCQDGDASGEKRKEAGNRDDHPTGNPDAVNENESANPDEVFKAIEVVYGVDGSIDDEEEEDDEFEREADLAPQGEEGEEYVEAVEPPTDTGDEDDSDSEADLAPQGEEGEEYVEAVEPPIDIGEEEEEELDR